MASTSGGIQTDASTRTRGSTIVWFCTVFCARRSLGMMIRRPSSLLTYV